MSQITIITQFNDKLINEQQKINIIEYVKEIKNKLVNNLY